MNLKLITALLLLTSCTLRAQLLDLDPNFSVDGISTYAFDLPGSNFGDTGVAVFPGATSINYVLVSKATTATSKRKIVLSNINSAGTSSTPTIDTAEFDDVDAACRPDDGTGRIYVVSHNNLGADQTTFSVKRFLSNLMLDTSFGTNGTLSGGISADSSISAIACNSTALLAVGSSTSSTNPGVGTVFLRVVFAGPTLAFTLSPASAGNQDLGRSVAITDADQFIVTSSLSGSSQPTGLRFRVLPNVTNFAIATTTDFPLTTNCNFGAGSTIYGLSTAIDFPQRIVIALSTTNVNSTQRTTIAQGIVDASTSVVSGVGCGTALSTRNFSPRSLLQTSPTELYVYGSIDPPSIPESRQSLSRWTKSASGNWLPDLSYGDSNTAGYIYFNMPRNASAATPFFDYAAAGFIDTRPANQEVVLVGTAEYNNADTDASLIRLKKAGIFANGFE